MQTKTVGRTGLAAPAVQIAQPPKSPRTSVLLFVVPIMAASLTASYSPAALAQPRSQSPLASEIFSLRQCDIEPFIASIREFSDAENYAFHISSTRPSPAHFLIELFSDDLNIIISNRVEDQTYFFGFYLSCECEVPAGWGKSGPVNSVVEREKGLLESIIAKYSGHLPK
jgi:hypothetical protein